jgi:MFS family permease
VLIVEEILTFDSFQEVQYLSALQASIRLLPSLILGTILNLTTGLFVHRISAIYLVLISSALSAGAPLLMALINPEWPYWYNAFFAQILQPLSADVLFTVGMLIVSDVFPTHTQALAGGVFNTVTQFGTSIGLTVMAVISSTITEQSKYPKKTSPEALLVGYRATFWVALAWMITTCLIGAFGLCKVGKVGLKRD